jgi:Zn-finger nucleic acid-binding protein
MSEKIKRKDVHCPRDKSLMEVREVGEAHLDLCGKCHGQFFDTGEMFRAFGLKAHPSYWDRDETGGSMKESELHCPRCDSHMLGQDVSYESKKVEIDRCGHCGGIWLDKGEIDTIMQISDLLKPVLDAETAKAQAELAKLGEPQFAPGLIARFVKMFMKGG